MLRLHTPSPLPTPLPPGRDRDFFGMFLMKTSGRFMCELKTKSEANDTVPLLDGVLMTDGLRLALLPFISFISTPSLLLLLLLLSLSLSLWTGDMTSGGLSSSGGGSTSLLLSSTAAGVVETHVFFVFHTNTSMMM